MPLNNYVGSGGSYSSSRTYSDKRAAHRHSKGKFPPRSQGREGYADLAKRCHFRAQVAELVQRHKRDVQKAKGDRKTMKNKARHGYNFSVLRQTSARSLQIEKGYDGPIITMSIF
jgi:N-acetylmuramoyl-L-alanine amidase